MPPPPSDPRATPRTPAPQGDLRVSDLSTRSPTTFDIAPDAEARAAVARDFGLQGLRKLRLRGEINAKGASGWELTAMLGATLVQECGITLDPVTTRIDETVTRRYLPDLPEPDPGSIEIEMPENDSIEPLGSVISPWSVMIEALSLAVPAFPRSAGATTGEAVFTEPGTRPMRDEDARPFAGLAGLRARMDDDPGQ